jgi:hypothetical protein
MDRKTHKAWLQSLLRITSGHYLLFFQIRDALDVAFHESKRLIAIPVRNSSHALERALEDE